MNNPFQVRNHHPDKVTPSPQLSRQSYASTENQANFFFNNLQSFKPDTFNVMNSHIVPIAPNQVQPPYPNLRLDPRVEQKQEKHLFKSAFPIPTELREKQKIFQDDLQSQPSSIIYHQEKNQTYQTIPDELEQPSFIQYDDRAKVFLPQQQKFVNNKTPLPVKNHILKESQFQLQQEQIFQPKPLNQSAQAMNTNIRNKEQQIFQVNSDQTDKILIQLQSELESQKKEQLQSQTLILQKIESLAVNLQNLQQERIQPQQNLGQSRQNQQDQSQLLLQNQYFELYKEIIKLKEMQYQQLILQNNRQSPPAIQEWQSPPAKQQYDQYSQQETGYDQRFYPAQTSEIYFNKSPQNQRNSQQTQTQLQNQDRQTQIHPGSLKNDKVQLLISSPSNPLTPPKLRPMNHFQEYQEETSSGPFLKQRPNEVQNFQQEQYESPKQQNQAEVRADENQFQKQRAISVKQTQKVTPRKLQSQIEGSFKKDSPENNQYTQQQKSKKASNRIFTPINYNQVTIANPQSALTGLQINQQQGTFSNVNQKSFEMPYDQTPQQYNQPMKFTLQQQYETQRRQNEQSTIIQFQQEEIFKGNHQMQFNHNNAANQNQIQENLAQSNLSLSQSMGVANQNELIYQYLQTTYGSYTIPKHSSDAQSISQLESKEALDYIFCAVCQQFIPTSKANVHAKYCQQQKKEQSWEDLLCKVCSTVEQSNVRLTVEQKKKQFQLCDVNLEKVHYLVEKILKVQNSQDEAVTQIQCVSLIMIELLLEEKKNKELLAKIRNDLALAFNLLENFRLSSQFMFFVQKALEIAKVKGDMM